MFDGCNCPVEITADIIGGKWRASEENPGGHKENVDAAIA
jgi:hypothetical protein